MWTVERGKRRRWNSRADGAPSSWPTLASERSKRRRDSEKLRKKCLTKQQPKSSQVDEHESVHPRTSPNTKWDKHKIYSGTRDNPTVWSQVLSRNQQDEDISHTRNSQYNYSHFLIRDLETREHWDSVFRMLKGKWSSSFKFKGEIKHSQTNKKPKEFITTKPNTKQYSESFRF